MVFVEKIEPYENSVPVLYAESNLCKVLW